MRLPDHPRDRFRLWAGAAVGVLSLLTPVWAVIWHQLALRTNPDPFGIWFFALGAAFAGPIVAGLLMPPTFERRGTAFTAMFVLSLTGTLFASTF